MSQESQDGKKISHELQHHHFGQAHKDLIHELHKHPRDFNKLLHSINHDLRAHHQHMLSVEHDHGKHISHINFGKHDIYNGKHEHSGKPGHLKSEVPTLPAKPPELRTQPASPLESSQSSPNGAAEKPLVEPRPMAQKPAEAPVTAPLDSSKPAETPVTAPLDSPKPEETRLTDMQPPATEEVMNKSVDQFIARQKDASSTAYDLVNNSTWSKTGEFDDAAKTTLKAAIERHGSDIGQFNDALNDAIADSKSTDFRISLKYEQNLPDNLHGNYEFIKSASTVTQDGTTLPGGFEQTGTTMRGL